MIKKTPNMFDEHVSLKFSERLISVIVHTGVLILLMLSAFRWAQFKDFVFSASPFDAVYILTLLIICNFIYLIIILQSKSFAKIKWWSPAFIAICFGVSCIFFPSTTMITTSTLVICAVYPSLIDSKPYRGQIWGPTLFGIALAGFLLGHYLLIDTFWPQRVSTESDPIVVAICMGLLTIVVLWILDAKNSLQMNLTSSDRRYGAIFRKQFPPFIASRLLNGEQMFASHYENVGVLFSDLADFTALTKRMPPDALVTMLHELFCEFDDACTRLKCNKIKTIGDGYLVAKGLEGETPIDSTLNLIHLAEEFYTIIAKFNRNYSASISLRVGINTGPVIAGILGKTRTTFDLWGRTVNFASRLEAGTDHDTVMLSEFSYALVASYLGKANPMSIDLKGLGAVQAYRISLTEGHFRSKILR